MPAISPRVSGPLTTLAIVPTGAPTTVGLVLAAGAATRFGSPKQLAGWAGAPLVTRPVTALRAGGVERNLVVLGANADRIAPALESVDIVVADDWQDGLSASLRAGVRAAADLGAERVVVVLGDQPLLSGAAVAAVLAEAQAGAGAIVRATYNGIPGHPTVLSRATFSPIAQLRGDAGARELRGFAVQKVACDGLGSPEDVDTYEDLLALSSRSGRGGCTPGA